MPQDISTLETQEDEQLSLPEEDFSKAFEDDSFEESKEEEVDDSSAEEAKDEETDEETTSETEEQSEEKEEETEEQKDEESLLDKLEKVAKEKFSDLEEEQDKEKETPDEKGENKDEVDEQPEIEVDFSDVDADPIGYVSKLVDAIDDSGVRDRLSELVSTNPEIGELAAVVARSLVERQKVKVVKDENSFDFSKDEFEALNNKLSELEKAEQDRVARDAEIQYWEDLESVYPGARAKDKDKEFQDWLGKQSELVQKMTMTYNPDNHKQVFEAYEEAMTREKARAEVEKQTENKKKRDQALTSVDGTSSKPGSKAAQNLGFEEAFERFLDE